MREEVVDTSVFLSSLVADDEKHNEAIALMEEMDKEETIFHVPSLVILEIIATLSRLAGVEEAREAKNVIDFWIDRGKIKVHHFDLKQMDEAVEIALNRRLHLADAVVIQLAEERGLPLISMMRKS
ncbi:MAG: PIN domain-containing protein [Chloroflexi bacterium]|jgi:predicted nucleic acid-binding protein|nr:PIN domain-containing protein [Chloroflexota bacterium]MBT7080682.1 PIN domain-containing protein [Chloroflexota bacterium]MBT7289591.1 PIN domain-containing protein [Chloroflexota bacterium]